jgi:predicted ATPase
MVQSLDLSNFKAFERFTVNFRTTSFLAGPNNAGKSTIIAALRACTYMLRQAKRKRPTEVFVDRRVEVLGYSFFSEQMALVDENLRHELRENESRLILRFGPQTSLTAVWPLETRDSTPFYYLKAEGISVHTSREAAERFPSIGIVPILSPARSPRVSADAQVRP